MYCKHFGSFYHILYNDDQTMDCFPIKLAHENMKYNIMYNVCVTARSNFHYASKHVKNNKTSDSNLNSFDHFEIDNRRKSYIK